MALCRSLCPNSNPWFLRGAGANRVLAMDLHSGQCVGYFDIPVDHVYGDSVILDYLASKRICTGDLVVVSPDVGGVARARAFAKKLNDAPLVRCRRLAADGVVPSLSLTTLNLTCAARVRSHCMAGMPGHELGSISPVSLPTATLVQSVLEL